MTIPSPTGRSASSMKWPPSSAPRKPSAKGTGKSENAAMMRKAVASLDDKRLQQQAKNVLRVNGMAVEDSGRTT
jgi:hypothetical protein